MRRILFHGISYDLDDPEDAASYAEAKYSYEAGAENERYERRYYNGGED
jgi:hypothetical protein